MSKKPFGVATIYVILGLVFIALIGIRTMSTPEIWTHLAQGRTNAPISYIEAVDSINTTHLYDKIVYGLWNIGQAPALIIFNIIALLASFILLLKTAQKWGGELSQGFALLISGQLIFQSIDVAPQTMMMFFIALFIYVLSTFSKPAVLFAALIPAQILWANMHGSFFFGPIIAIIATIQASKASNGPKRSKKQKSANTTQLAILTVALLLATLINPYFAKLHGQVLQNIAMPYPTYLTSLLREYFQTPGQDPLIFLVFILGAGGLITLKKRLPIMLTTLAIFGAFLVILRSMYSAQLFTVLAFPFMVLSFTAIGEYLTGSLKTLLGKKEKFLAPITQGILVILLILSVYPILTNCAYVKYGSASNFGIGAQEELFPSETEAIINHPAFPEKALNLAADGGYLAWKYPARKIFIDYRPGRYDLELLEELTAMMRGSTKAYDSIYETYRPEAIIINTLSPFSAQGVATLLARKTWKLAYFDGTTVILLLDKPEFAPILNNKAAQAAGLARLEAARANYAAKLDKGCHAGNPAELIGSGKIFLALNRPAHAKAIFSLLLRGNNKTPEAWIGLGKSQLYLKEFDQAAASQKMATTLAPENLLAWGSYAQACQYAGLTDELKIAEEKIKELRQKQAKKNDAEPTADKPRKAERETETSLLDMTIPE